MAQTSNFNFNRYDPTELPAPLKEYNENLEDIDREIAARGVHPVEVATSGTTHNIAASESFDTLKFIAQSDFAAGDTLTLNGTSQTISDAEGNPYTAEAWKAGDTVILSCRPDGVRVLVPNRRKADKGTPAPVSMTVYSGYSSDTHGIVRKNDSNLVMGNVYASAASGRIPTGTWVAIGKLPAGYTPITEYAAIPASVHTDGAFKNITCLTRVTTAGEVQVHVPSGSAVARVFITLLYYAA